MAYWAVCESKIRSFGGRATAHRVLYFDIGMSAIPARDPLPAGGCGFILGPQEVRAYLILLYVQASDLGDEDKQQIRELVRKQVSKSWQGKRVDRAFM